MPKTTITEALAELKTIGKKLGTKQAYVLQYVARSAVLRDPLERQGGSQRVIAQEQQAIQDLETRVIAIRAAIAKANQEQIIKIGNTERTIADWLTWRRDVAPGTQSFYAKLRNTIDTTRHRAGMQEPRVYGAAVQVNQQSQVDPNVTIELDETVLQRRIEELETTLGELDGRLSLANATVTIEVP